MSSVDEEKLKELKRNLECFKKGDKVKTRSRTTPLAKLFGQISKQIENYESQSDPIDYLFNSFRNSNNESTDILNDKVEKRKYVIDIILNYFEKINELSAKQENADIISIPLYDMKVVGELTNILIVQGIYAILPHEFLIPLEKRKIKNFKVSNIKFERVSLDAGTEILKNILRTLTNIFESNSDLKDLILIGTGFTDTLSIAIFFSVESSESSESNYYLERLEKQSSTYQLLSYYSLLYQNSKKNIKLSQSLLNSLQRQLLQSNGVEALIDLVMGLREDDDVDISKITYIVQLLINSRPKTQVGTYFENIFNQLYKLLVMINRPMMNTIVVNIVTSIYHMNKKVVTDFLFKPVWNNFVPELKKNSDDIVLTTGINLNNAFNVCLSISRNINDANSDFINEFFEPIIISVWFYANFQRKNKKDYDIVLNLIKNIFIIGDSDLFISLILDNLINNNGSSWCYAIDTESNEEHNLTYIKYNTNETIVTKENQILQLFDKIDFNVDTLVELIQKLNDLDSKYLNQFIIEILNKMINKDEISNTEIPVKKIISLKSIQIVLDKFKDNIENSPISLLIFLNTYFVQYFESAKSKSSLDIVKTEIDSDDEMEDIDNSNSVDANDEIVTSLVPILDVISNITIANEDEKIQLSNLQSLFKSNSKYIPSSINYLTDKIIQIDINITFREKSNKFDLETIVKQINDPTPSVRVYALDKLTQYTVGDELHKSVSTKYTLNLLLSQLKDEEPFVYLNAIKNIFLVISFDKTFLSYVIELYYASKKSMDEKLRIGEILTRFISHNGKILDTTQIKEIIQTCINMSRCDSELDDKIKMSSLSLLGLICFETGYAINPYIRELADLVHGIITFEKNPELRRAAVVIIHDIVRNENGLEILKEYGEKLQVLLEYISDKDQDLLVCQLATETLNDLDSVFESKFKIVN